jgi:uncharacterized membrane protein
MIEIISNLHSKFVYFPIAFATASVAFTIAGKLFGKRPWASQFLLMGRWMLWGAALSACIAAVFGMFAFNNAANDEAGQLAMTIHCNWGIGAVGALVFLSGWSIQTFTSFDIPINAFIYLLITVWFLLLIAAWNGVEVVYHHGLGVMALPEVNDDQNILPTDNRRELRR